MLKHPSVRDEKKALRKKYSAIRSSISKEERKEYSENICKNFLNTLAYKHSDTVLLYYSINNEVETLNLIDEILKSNKKLALPVCRENGTMTFKYITDKTTLVKGIFSALEPDESCEEFSSSPHTICVIPAIAFDKEGYRLGYGKGYYDRFLTDPSITKVGFSYHELFVDKLPRGRFDMSCDLVITPKGVFNTVKKQ